MPINWTMQRANGETRTFVDWGISSAKCTFINQGVDTVELGFGRADLLGDLGFNPSETLLVLLNGAPFFRGRLTGEKRAAQGSIEGAPIVLSGAWWYLEKIIYMKPALVVSDGTQNPIPADPVAGLQISDFNLTQRWVSDIVVSIDQTGSKVDSAGMVRDVLNYAISKGAPIAIGTIAPGIPITRDEIRDATCAEVIIRSLRWTPDQVAWWDYSVTPPQFNVTKRADRILTAIDLADAATTSVDLTPRRDLVLSGVLLEYVRKHQRNNFEFTTVDYDIAGPLSNGIGSLVLTLELYGSYVVMGGPPTAPVEVLVPQEPAPAGLASYLYNAYKDLNFDGRISILRSTPLTNWLRSTVRVLNGLPLWASAVMDIQQASLDLLPLRNDAGDFLTTELTIGPAKHLSATDLLGLVRKGRTAPPPRLNDPFLPQVRVDPNFPPINSKDPNAPIGPALNPDGTSSGNAPDVILNYFYGQDVGYPNSYGGFDGDAATVFANRPPGVPYGARVLTGSANPAAGLGRDGDYYIQNDNSLWGPKAGGAWPPAPIPVDNTVLGRIRAATMASAPVITTYLGLKFTRQDIRVPRDGVLIGRMRNNDWLSSGSQPDVRAYPPPPPPPPP